MGDDHLAVRDLGRRDRQSIGDVLVGKSVETVAAHAFQIERLGDCEPVGDLGMAPVERRVETGNLQHVRQSLAKRADRCQVVGLMQRRQRNERNELIDHFVADHCRPRVLHPAVDDAMADRHR